MKPPLRPPDRLDVDVTAVTPDGRARPHRSPVVAMAVAIVAIAVAIGLAQVFPAEKTPVDASVRPAVAPSLPTAAPVAVSPQPEASFSFARRLGRQALVAGVLDGSLEGWMVYADAELRLDCPTGTGAPCSALPPRIAGLPIRGTATEAPDARLDAVPARGLLVLRVVGTGFEYEGSLVADPDGSPTLSALDEERRAGSAPPAGPTLRDASGWLVRAGPCLIPPSAFEPCPRQPFLAEEEPLATADPSTTAGRFVEVARDAWGIDPPFDPILAGPFLVRHLEPARPDDPAWEIVARYDPSRSVRVVIP